MRTFSYYEKVLFLFDPVAFFFEMFLPQLPMMFSTDLIQLDSALLKEPTKLL